MECNRYCLTRIMLSSEQTRSSYRFVCLSFHLDYRKLKVTDLAFALDGSRKLTEQEFSRLKSFVKTVIQDYQVSETGTHVAVIEYSDAARVAISFKDTKDVDSFKQAIDRVRPSRGKMTSVTEALKLAREELFSPIGGGRPGIAKVRFRFSDLLHGSCIFNYVLIYRTSSSTFTCAYSRSFLFIAFLFIAFLFISST